MPCTPVPGGVADEHKYAFGMGVVHGLSRNVGPTMAREQGGSADDDVASHVIGIVGRHLG